MTAPTINLARIVTLVVDYRQDILEGKAAPAGRDSLEDVEVIERILWAVDNGRGDFYGFEQDLIARLIAAELNAIREGRIRYGAGDDTDQAVRELEAILAEIRRHGAA